MAARARQRGWWERYRGTLAGRTAWTSRRWNGMPSLHADHDADVPTFRVCSRPRTTPAPYSAPSCRRRHALEVELRARRTVWSVSRYFERPEPLTLDVGLRPRGSAAYEVRRSRRHAAPAEAPAATCRSARASTMRVHPGGRGRLPRGWTCSVCTPEVDCTSASTQCSSTRHARPGIHRHAESQLCEVPCPPGRGWTRRDARPRRLRETSSATSPAFTLGRSPCETSAGKSPTAAKATTASA